MRVETRRSVLEQPGIPGCGLVGAKSQREPLRISQRRRHGCAVRRLPALAAEIHDLRADHQVLYDKIRVAFEARTLRRRCDLDGPLLVDRKLRRLAALAARLASRRRRFRLRRLVASTWLGGPASRTASY